MTENKDVEGAADKSASTTRKSHDLRNMRLAGAERNLALVVGNLIAGRAGPNLQEKIFDTLQSEISKKQREELLSAIEENEIDYGSAEGLARQKARNEACDKYPALKRESERRPPQTLKPADAQ